MTVKKCRYVAFHCSSLEGENENCCYWLCSPEAKERSCSSLANPLLYMM